MNTIIFFLLLILDSSKFLGCSQQNTKVRKNKGLLFSIRQVSIFLSVSRETLKTFQPSPLPPVYDTLKC